MQGNPLPQFPVWPIDDDAVVVAGELEEVYK